MCPTLFKNITELSRRWIYTDDNVYLCDLDIALNEAIDLYRNVFDGIQTLFIGDDCFSTQDIKYRKKRAR